MDDQRTEHGLSGLFGPPERFLCRGVSVVVHPPTVADAIAFAEVCETDDAGGRAAWLVWAHAELDGVRVREAVGPSDVLGLHGPLVLEVASRVSDLYASASRPREPPAG